MKPKFLKILLIVNLFFIFSHISYSEEIDTTKTNVSKDKKEERNYLKKGAWALQFAIDQNFTLTNFDGSTLSLKGIFLRILL